MAIFNRQFLLVFIMLITSGSSQHVMASVNSWVFCGSPDGRHWQWLLDRDNNYISVEGVWGRHLIDGGEYFNVFRISEEIYSDIRDLCPTGLMPQPADRATSAWEVFEVSNSDGSTTVVDAYKTIYRQADNWATKNFQIRV
ncbi:hypothetical protein [Aeromonas sp. HMWF015]|uniref:hypothetical protein n=1 Tax=Aeromonas sp. HMWF015 TaxID=2056851 RepID=UPI0011B281C3|nr:hypothetical protein [Aeromonas sp. HMWF015]